MFESIINKFNEEWAITNQLAHAEAKNGLIEWNWVDSLIGTSPSSIFLSILVFENGFETLKFSQEECSHKTELCLIKSFVICYWNMKAKKKNGFCVVSQAQIEALHSVTLTEKTPAVCVCKFVQFPFNERYIVAFYSIEFMFLLRVLLHLHSSSLSRSITRTWNGKIILHLWNNFDLIEWKYVCCCRTAYKLILCHL